MISSDLGVNAIILLAAVCYDKQRLPPTRCLSWYTLLTKGVVRLQRYAFLSIPHPNLPTHHTKARIASCWGVMRAFILLHVYKGILRSHPTYKAHEFAFEVRGFVLMEGIALSELIDCRDNLRQHLLCDCLIGCIAEVADEVAGGLFVITVVQTAFCRLANTLFRRLMICHCK